LDNIYVQQEKIRRVYNTSKILFRNKATWWTL